MLIEKLANKDSVNHDLPEKKIDNQQEYILTQVALRLFHERGYGKVKLSDIAKAAGMTLKDTRNYFTSREEICLQVIAAHADHQLTEFTRINENSNPRQRLSLYLDTLVENSDMLIERGCAITNLYFDVKREDHELDRQAKKLLQQRLDWIREQFVVITRVDNNSDLPERLTSAIHGISILAQVTGSAKLIRTQVNQLKSWIRSM